MRSLALLTVVLAGACAGPRLRGNPDSAVWRYLQGRYDADHDGRLTRAEYSRSERGFRNLDVSGDGIVSALDFDPSFDEVLRGPWKSLEEFEYGEGGPAVGELAPPLRLESTAGETIDLASFSGRKPVALVFGSFT
jgi:hypothetical protein